MLVPSRSRPRSALLVLLAFLLPSMAPSQDLAAVARKEKERRAKVTKPAKVLTEGDGKDASAKGAGSVTSLGASTAGGSSASSAASGGGAATTDPEAQRASWKARADATRNAVTAAEAKLTQMERDLAAYRSDISPVSAADAMDPMRLQKREALINKLNKDIEAQKGTVVEAKKAVATLEDEARRNGVPAGWLR